MIIFEHMVIIDQKSSSEHFRCLDTLAGGRFHQQLRDTFAPLVVRYVDLMESCIAQSIHKGFEKENWKIKT